VTHYLERILADQRDADAWHAARVGRIGASNAASFAYDKPSSIVSYVRKQLMPSYSGSLAMGHGHEREALLLPELGWEQNNFMIASEFNDKFSATPDGIDESTHRLAQMKTSVHPLGKTIPPKFLRQIWWEQMVMGPEWRSSDLIFEQYTLDGENYIPSFSPEIYQVDRDDEAILFLAGIATRVLEGMEIASEETGW